MDENILEIRAYQGEGYQPLVDFASWRVAILRYEEAGRADRIDMVERHTQTDEVFVLLSGQAILVLGGIDDRLAELIPQVMEAGIIYNVKRNAWHTTMLNRDASVLIVENQDTTEQNSEYTRLSDQQRNWIVQLARREGIG